MILEILLATSQVYWPSFAKAEPVYLADPKRWEIRHCLCVHLPDFSEYCTNGWGWNTFSRYEIHGTEQDARNSLKRTRLKLLNELNKLDLDKAPVYEQIVDHDTMEGFQ